jgi:hypothetical protein
VWETEGVTVDFRVVRLDDKVDIISGDESCGCCDE